MAIRAAIEACGWNVRQGTRPAAVIHHVPAGAFSIKGRNIGSATSIPAMNANRYACMFGRRNTIHGASIANTA